MNQSMRITFFNFSASSSLLHPVLSFRAIYIFVMSDSQKFYDSAARTVVFAYLFFYFMECEDHMKVYELKKTNSIQNLSWS